MTETMTLTVRIHSGGDHVWAEVDELPGLFVTGFDAKELEEALIEAIGLYLSDSEAERTVTVEFVDPPREQVRHARAKVALAG